MGLSHQRNGIIHPQGETGGFTMVCRNSYQAEKHTLKLQAENQSCIFFLSKMQTSRITAFHCGFLCVCVLTPCLRLSSQTNQPLKKCCAITFLPKYSIIFVNNICKYFVISRKNCQKLLFGNRLLECRMTWQKALQG